MKRKHAGHGKRLLDKTNVAKAGKFQGIERQRWRKIDIVRNREKRWRMRELARE